MKKRLWIINLFLLYLSAGLLVRGQFTPQEIAQREQWEEFLKTAEIVRFERIPEGVTKPWKLYLKKEGIEKKAAWKNVDEDLGGGVMDSWRYEIAAYRLDKLIGLNMVPPTVEREFRKKRAPFLYGQTVNGTPWKSWTRASKSQNRPGNRQRT